MCTPKPLWYVYIVSCSDKTLYTGITTGLSRRIAQHNSQKDGAKYTRGRQPVALVYHEVYSTRSQASKREYQLKKLTSAQKQLLINKSTLTPAT